MIKTYLGSCHCRAVTFEADIDLARGTIKCNCSICTKTRNWSAVIRPESFRLLTGLAALSDYGFGAHIGHHMFCGYCGVRPFGRGRLDPEDGEYISIQLATLDNLEPLELIAAPVRYLDGRHNLWELSPAVTQHL